MGTEFCFCSVRSLPFVINNCSFLNFSWQLLQSLLLNRGKALPQKTLKKTTPNSTPKCLCFSSQALTLCSARCGCITSPQWEAFPFGHYVNASDPKQSSTEQWNPQSHVLSSSALDLSQIFFFLKGALLFTSSSLFKHVQVQPIAELLWLIARAASSEKPHTHKLNGLEYRRFGLMTNPCTFLQSYVITCPLGW